MNTVMEKLKDALSAKESGTMYINTDDGRAGIVSYQNGVVIGVMTGSMRGSDALEFLVTAAPSRYKLQERSVQLPDSQPSPDDVVNLLGLAEIPTAPVIANTPQSTELAVDLAVQSKAFAIITKHLVEFAGPIGTMLVDEVEQSFTLEMDGPEAFESALQVLVQEISDLNESNQFLQNTRAELATLFGKTGESTEQNHASVESKGVGMANGPSFKWQPGLA